MLHALCHMCMIDDMFFFGRLHEPRNHMTAAYNCMFFLGCYCSMNVITHVQYYFVLFCNPVVFLPDILLFSCLPAVQYSPIPRFDVWLTSSPVFSCRSEIHLSNIGTSFFSIFRCPAVPIIFCRRPPFQYLAILTLDILLGSSYFTCYRPSFAFSAVLLSNTLISCSEFRIILSQCSIF
jgi:hypothetical protein